MRPHADISCTADREWLPDMDLNHDKQIQSLLCYRYTIGQRSGNKVGASQVESRMVGCLVKTLKGENVKTEVPKSGSGFSLLQFARPPFHRFNVLTLQRFNVFTS